LRRVIFWLALWLVAAFGATGEDARARLALVIGNAGYANTPALANPVNDAEDVAKALTSAGFAVTLKRNLGKRDFDLAIAQFTRDARDAEAALFYYAGHGMQYDGVNYVMPVDAVLRDYVSLRYEMVSVDEVKLALESSPGVKILVLDSCRDNPLAKRLMRSLSGAGRGLSGGQGLAPAQPTTGMIIVYATQSGHVALDGTQRNSPFAKAFVEELSKPGLEVAMLFRGVEQKVLTATGGKQSPELSISGVPEYYMTEASPDRRAWDKASAAGDAEALIDFLSRFPASPYARQASAKLQSLQGAKAGDPVEALFWQSTNKGGTIADYAIYLKKYPTGAFAAIAVNRIAALASKPSPAPSSVAETIRASPPIAADAPDVVSNATRPIAAPRPAPRRLVLPAAPHN
jgi:uncharacterized caspase-like protein